MRKDSLLAGLVGLFVFGCATEPRLLDEFSDQTSLTSNRIVIIAHSACGIHGGGMSQYHWVLEKDGKSHGRVYHETGGPGTTTSYEFGPGVHEECLAKLEETKFFRMRSAIATVQFEASSATIEIHYHGKKHVVTHVGSAEIDDGFNKMWLFLGDVQKRSTVVSTKPSPDSPARPIP
jgi:hypothetical protein